MNEDNALMFEPLRLVTNIRYNVDSMAAFDNFLYIGTAEGRLLIYRVVPVLKDHPQFFIPQTDSPTNSRVTTPSEETIHTLKFQTVTLTTKSFRRPITNLTTVPEHRILLAIADQNVTAFDLPNCITLCQVPSSSGASSFAIFLTNSKSKPDNSAVKGSPKILRICVVVKKKLYFWKWEATEKIFRSPKEAKDPLMQCWPSEMTLQEAPKFVEFVSVSQLLVGYRADYQVLDIVTGSCKSICMLGKNQVASASLVPYCLDPLNAMQDFPGHRNLYQLNSKESFSVADLSHSSRAIFRHDHFAPISAALIRDSETLIPLPVVNELESEGNHTSLLGDGNNLVVKWQAPLFGLLTLPPFVFGMMEHSLEIRTLEPNRLVQVIGLSQISAMCHCRGWMFVACTGGLVSPISTPQRSAFGSKTSKSTEIWLILLPKRSYWVEYLAQRCEFELAMRMAEITQLSGQSPIDAHDVATKYAFHLYKQRQFLKSVDLFFRLKIDPSHVLGLFPDFIPQHLREQIHFPDILIEFNEEEKEKEVYDSLITFLISWRNILRAKIASCQTCGENAANEVYPVTCEIDCYPISEESPMIQDAESLLEIVDTSLLKCYLLTNVTRIAPLLRIDHRCSLQESEKALIEHNRLQDLILLYQSHGLHRKSLDLLDRALQGLSLQNGQDLTGTGLPEKGDCRPLCKYMRDWLTPLQLDVVFEYGATVLQNHPRCWLNTFLAWEARMWNNSTDAGIPLPVYRQKVLKHLDSVCPSVSLPFLEQVIFAQFDKFDEDQIDFYETSSIDLDAFTDPE
ncbi:Vam6/Vps39-like protein, partial [Cichlidogyrus casuarinus]